MDHEKDKTNRASAPGAFYERQSQPELVQRPDDPLRQVEPVRPSEQQPSPEPFDPWVRTQSKPPATSNKQQHPSTQSKPPKKKIAWVFIVICCALAVVNLAIYIAFFSKPPLKDSQAAAKLANAQQLIQQHKFAEAETLLETGKNRKTSDGLELLLELAYAYMRDDKLDKAVETCRYAACDQPKGQVFAMRKVSTRLFKEQKYAEAFKLSDYAISFNASQSSPEYIVLARDHLNRGGCRAFNFNETRDMAELELALADYKSAVEIFKAKAPTDPDHFRAERQVETIEKIKHEILHPKRGKASNPLVDLIRTLLKP